MSEVLRTPEFEKWLDGLKDPKAYARIITRLYRLGLGNPGDAKPVREGLVD